MAYLRKAPKNGLDLAEQLKHFCVSRLSAVCSFQNLRYMYGDIDPIGSMYAIYGNIYHQYTLNVSIYTIHGSYGDGHRVKMNIWWRLGLSLYKSLSCSTVPEEYPAPWGHVPQGSVREGDDSYSKSGPHGRDSERTKWCSFQIVSADVISAGKFHNQLIVSQPLRMARPGHSLHTPVYLMIVMKKTCWDSY